METTEDKIEILQSTGDDDTPTTEKELTDSWTMLDKQEALKTSPVKIVDEGPERIPES